MKLNVAGLFHLTQCLLPHISSKASLENPSRIINIGSVMGTAPLGDGPYSYSASKAAVHQITKILAKESAHSSQFNECQNHAIIFNNKFFTTLTILQNTQNVIL